MSKPLALLGLLLVLAAVALVASVYSTLPDPMPSHWNARGQVNGWLPKFWGAYLTPMVMGLIWLLFVVLPRMSPRGFEMTPFARAWGFFSLSVLAFLFFVLLLVLDAARGPGPFSSRALLVGLGVLFVLIGAFLGKVTRNYFAGIRTPWTLSSEEVWRRTHRLAGKLFIAAGLVVIATSLAGLGLWPFIVAIALATTIPIVYSYVIYRELANRPPTP